MKTCYFVSGLPRSGSTLLCNLLAQNPRFFVTPTSGLISIVEGIKRGWSSIPEYRAMPEADSSRYCKGILLGVFAGAYSDHEIVFDKNRGWPAHIETLDSLFEQVKIIAPVREIVEIISSFEVLYRKSSALNTMAFPEGIDGSKLSERVRYWMSDKGTIGSAYNALMQAVLRGHGDKIWFVDFDDFVISPNDTMRGIYEFLGEEFYQHRFSDIEQVTHEDDRIYGFSGLHTIRQNIEPRPKIAADIIGDLVKKYQKMEFWKAT